RRHTRSYGDWSSDVCSSDLSSAALYTADHGNRVHEMRVHAPTELFLARTELLQAFPLDACGETVCRLVMAGEAGRRTLPKLNQRIIRFTFPVIHPSIGSVRSYAGAMALAPRSCHRLLT